MEFEALVFCGDGRRLSPVAGESMTKAMLPVANKPLLAHTLEWCEKAMFKKITLVCTPMSIREITAYVELQPGSRSIPIEIAEFASTTGETLACLASKIDSDFVVLPCDFITDLDPEQLLSVHRASDIKNLVTGFYYRNTIESIDTKKVLGPDVLLHTPFDKDGQAVLLDAYERQFVKDNKHLDVRMAMLWKFGNAVASTDLLYTSIYVCRRPVLDILSEADEDASVAVENKTVHKLMRNFARRTWQHRKKLDTIAVAQLPASACYIRANNLPAYLEANRHIMKVRARDMAKSGTAAAPAAKEKGAALVGNDSLVGDESALGAKSSVKRSVIGSNCTIGTKCRITGCVVLDGTTISNDVVLENCIIGRAAVIRDRVRLTSCEVEGGYEVPSGFEAKNDVLKGLSMSGLDDEEYENLYESLSEDEDDGDADEGSSDADEIEEEEYDAEDDFFDRG
ncbi:Translation initiation factor eIF-2B subunit gamma [Wickerhamiella sorbophila]|uniref:Translation initiation factor eIF2B subunit gamma n=1 Tax=Wickerhamiella sorbophila TaxID=45607 RepID=A0A2T0FL12_9ASCO|nr:Translation initiation factor eIF-2B subunit gamma [Wickerhamiella sorbophila]PRT55681.1 Translation initiation factor eIF-2B subunit gamma [Wickerhamiella sorbophila]